MIGLFILVVPFSICMYIKDVYYNHYSNEDESNTNHITSNSEYIHTVFLIWTIWNKQITLKDKHIMLDLNNKTTYVCTFFWNAIFINFRWRKLGIWHTNKLLLLLKKTPHKYAVTLDLFVGDKFLCQTIDFF